MNLIIIVRNSLLFSNPRILYHSYCQRMNARSINRRSTVRIFEKIFITVNLTIFNLLLILQRSHALLVLSWPMFSLLLNIFINLNTLSTSQLFCFTRFHTSADQHFAPIMISKARPNSTSFIRSFNAFSISSSG